MKRPRWERWREGAQTALVVGGLAVAGIVGTVLIVLLQILLTAAPFALVIFAAIWAWRHL
jgi:hypothetical protein